MDCKQIINEIKEEVLYQLENYNIDDLCKIANVIGSHQKNIFTLGVGKSGNVAKHFCDLLKCISIKAFNLDLVNLTHGDIGVLEENDMVIIISNSGNTQEILYVLPIFKKLNIKLVGIFCNKSCKIKEFCDHTLISPCKSELSGLIDKIPTNSVSSQITTCNIIITLLKRRITLEQYKNNHLGGNIGNLLQKVSEIMVYEYPTLSISNRGIELHSILLEMTKYSIGCIFFVDNGILVGLLTDGDIRRLLIQDRDIDVITISDINKNYYRIENDDIYVYEIKEVMKKFTYIPIVTNGKINGVIKGSA